MLYKNGKIVVGPDANLRSKLINWHHSSVEGGHSGREITLKRIKSLFYWKGMTQHVRQFVRAFLVCQKSKTETIASPGLLQPLPLPEEVWTDVSMDFISGLPKSNGKNVIFVVVDRLSKYAHFMTLSHPFTAIHGWPRSIVSDRDSVFLSTFWKGLFGLHGTEFLLSSAYHPQTDGQTEVVNMCLETYLRCMCSENSKDWSS